MPLDEKVLCVPAALIEQLGGVHGFEADVNRFLPALMDRKNQSFVARAECETDPSLKQLIPYIVICYEDYAEGETYVFQYTRGKGQGEARLHALRSLGIGGHISTDDTFGDDWYGNGMQRELEEEVVLDFQKGSEIVGLIYDHSNDVGKVHLGIVHLMKLEGPHARAREVDLVESGFVAIRQVRMDRHRLETWSQLCLDHLFPVPVTS